MSMSDVTLPNRQAASLRVAQSLAGVKPNGQATAPAAAAGVATAGTTGGNTGISSSDFLTLLVTEMKNQDPTQPTDPNAYIQQLVGVNSLQQLISINQGLTSIELSAGGSTGGTSPVTGA